MLHDLEYLARFADDLRKSLPRIPIMERVEDFMAFSKAGSVLADLHLEYEDYACEADVEVNEREHSDIFMNDHTYYAVEKMRLSQQGHTWHDHLQCPYHRRRYP